jgi:hypothetical protein
MRSSATIEKGNTMHTMTEAILKQVKEAAYLEGAQTACLWFKEIYGEEIELTDAWATYMDAEEAN